MTSSGSSSSSEICGSGAATAPEAFLGLSFFFGCLGAVVFFDLVDLSLIYSQKTPSGMGRHCDPMFAKTSASSLLSLLT